MDMTDPRMVALIKFYKRTTVYLCVCLTVIAVLIIIRIVTA